MQDQWIPLVVGTCVKMGAVLEQQATDRRLTTLGGVMQCRASSLKRQQFTYMQPRRPTISLPMCYAFSALIDDSCKPISTRINAFCDAVGFRRK